MYQVKVDYLSSFAYKAASGGYSVNVALPKEGRAADGITPPALLLASLGSCLAVYLEKYLTGGRIKFEKFSIDVASDICREAPGYLKDIGVKIDIQGAELDERRRKALVDFLRNCPVHNTLTNAPSIKIEVAGK